MIETRYQDLTLQFERNYIATPERVFSAWTEPEKLELWFAPSDDMAVKAEVDLRVGGRYRVTMGPHVVEGIYQEVVQAKRLVFTWQWQGETPSNDMLVAVDFIPKESGTLVQLTHTRLADTQAVEQHTSGWQSLSDRLERFLDVQG